MQSPEKIDLLMVAVRRAGAALLELWPTAGRQQKELSVEKKSDGTLLSRADIISNDILVTTIRHLYPDDAILSEELPCDPQMLAQSRRVWVIDPLDGTSSFVHGRDDFSVLVGLAEGGSPTFGIMFFPALAKMIVACSQTGAVLDGVPIKVSRSKELLPKRLYIRNFTCSRPELASPMMDSGLALLKVASGELDGAIIKMTTHREWDLAAPAAVLLQAGGALSDETGQPIRFGTGVVGFKYAIASNKILHQQLQHLIP